MTPADDARTGDTPDAGARLVARELATVVRRASARGDLPGSFADELLSAPDHDGALAILLEAAEDTDHGATPFGADLLARLADGLFSSVERVSRSRAAAPLLEALRHHPELASRVLARDDVLESLLGGPRRPRLERALVRTLEAVAPLRPPATVAAVVRRLGDPEVGMERLGPGVTTLLVESFDDLAGLVMGVEGWIPVSGEELTRLLRRLQADPESSRRLSRRAAEHGRARMLVAVVDGQAQLTAALQRAVEVFEFLVPAEGAEPRLRDAHLASVTGLMRVTALQLMLGERPDEVPVDVAAAWPRDDLGRRLPVSLLDERATQGLLDALDRHDLLPLPG